MSASMSRARILQDELAGADVAPRAPGRRVLPADGLAAHLAHPFSSEQRHHVTAADDPGQPLSADDRDPPDAPLDQQVPDVLHIGVLADGDHRAGHHLARGLPAAVEQVVLADQADHRAFGAGHGDAADPVGAQQARDYRDRGVRGDGDYPGRHDLFDLHSPLLTDLTPPGSPSPREPWKPMNGSQNWTVPILLFSIVPAVFGHQK